MQLISTVSLIPNRNVARSTLPIHTPESIHSPNVKRSVLYLYTKIFHYKNILHVTNYINRKPMNNLYYCTPDELYENFLDYVYSIPYQLTNLYCTDIKLELTIFNKLLFTKLSSSPSNFIRLN